MRADVLVGSALLHGVAVALVVHWVPTTTPPPVARELPSRGEANESPLVEVVVLDEPVAPAPVPRAASSLDGSLASITHARATTSRESSTATTSHEPPTNAHEPPTNAHEPPTNAHEPPTNAHEPPTSAHEPPTSAHEPPTSAHEPATAASTNDGAGRIIRGESGPPMPSPAGGDLLHMRGPDLALAPGAAERIAAGGPELAGHARESGKLQSASGGGAVIRDRVTTVVVERDGNAHFYDKRDIDLHWHVPIPHLDVHDDLKELGDALQDWYRDPYAATRYGTTSELSELAKAVPGACDSWGDPLCDDPLAPEAEKRARQKSNNTVSLGGAADVTAWLYRRYAHADPYASRKAKLLDDTRAERVERGTAFRQEQAARSAELMQRTLEELWAREADPVVRRRALYELWADCADDDAGRRARAMVFGWIRAKLPAGSAGAYTPEELARMAPFAPYAE